MKRVNKNTKEKSENLFQENHPEENEIYFPAKDSDTVLFDKIGDYLKGRFDMEEVLNDPHLFRAENDVKGWLKEFDSNNKDNIATRNFVKDTLAEIYKEKELENEINRIHLEIEKNNVNEVTSDWVKDWNGAKSVDNDSNRKEEEIRKFVTDSLNTVHETTLNPKGHQEYKKVNKKQLIRYSSLSAAAAIGIFILIRILIPGSDPDKLFKSYYVPFDVKSDATRTLSNEVRDSYQTALINYKKGDYQSALKGFTETFNKDTTIVVSRFYTGITYIATGNYKQSVRMLGSISETSGEYQKEALWYLGLTYLETGEKERSAQCFAILVQTSEYYRDRADKILRRLRK